MDPPEPACAGAAGGQLYGAGRTWPQITTHGVSVAVVLGSRCRDNAQRLRADPAHLLAGVFVADLGSCRGAGQDAILAAISGLSGPENPKRWFFF